MNNTDVESTEYKNHQLLINIVHELQIEIQDLKKLQFESNLRQADENRKISQRVDELYEKYDELKNKQRFLETNWEKIQRLEKEIEGLETNRNYLCDKIIDIEKQFILLRQWIEGNHQNRICELEEQIPSLAQRYNISDLWTRQKFLEDRVKELEDKLNILNANAEYLSVEIKIILSF